MEFWPMLRFPTLPIWQFHIKNVIPHFNFVNSLIVCILPISTVCRKLPMLRLQDSKYLSSTSRVPDPSSLIKIRSPKRSSIRFGFFFKRIIRAAHRYIRLFWIFLKSYSFFLKKPSTKAKSISPSSSFFKSSRVFSTIICMCAFGYISR